MSQEERSTPDSRPTFTVLTATYNRADRLRHAYRSLAAQHYADFEWLIVDDGSTDCTAETVQDLSEQSPFPIRYLRQNHAHKKAAFNLGVAHARGKLLVALDDDDELPADALRILLDAWDGIGPRRGSYVGVTGLCTRPDGTVVGDRFPRDVFDATATDLFFQHRIAGEKFGCQRIDVLRRFPFPEDIAGFVPESLVWWEIARAGYKHRCINRVVRIYNETPGSLSSSGACTAVNAAGLYLLNWQRLQYFSDHFFTRPILLLKTAARFTRFALHLRHSGVSLPRRYRLTRLSAWMLVIVMAPVGFALYLRDR